ncbi:MAG: phosphoribosylamine--glycine ligase [Gemmatimonadota bacterium]|nr:phosphoribosylamine--glycine ligase [Gemmatimonadota bacterium]
MRVLIVGKGGREHAFAWKISRSPKVSRIYAAPGNPGMARHAACVDIGVDDVDALVEFARRERIDLTVVGPEDPLAGGLTDRFEAVGLRVFGPSKKAARIEADKDFALGLMHRYGIPTGRYRTFTDPDDARGSVADWGAPVVLKASGLAAGKGVLVCRTVDEALRAVDRVLVDREFGAAGEKLVLMEYLEGEEASITGFTDGEHVVCIVPSQDHKTIGEGDTGPNTGGMGAYAPAPVVTPEMQDSILKRVMLPTVKALAAEGRPYRGILYGGLIITENGPRVIEFNCRLGDPEAQVVLPLLKTDLVDIMEAVSEGTLKDLEIELDDRAATCVVLASGGYPGAYDTGYSISGLEEAETRDDVLVFHAGTARHGGTTVTDGGRVLGVTAVGENIRASVERAYEATGEIQFENAYFRRDIGHRALERAGN